MEEKLRSSGSYTKMENNYKKESDQMLPKIETEDGLNELQIHEGVSKENSTLTNILITALIGLSYLCLVSI